MVCGHNWEREMEETKNKKEERDLDRSALERLDCDSRRQRTRRGCVGSSRSIGRHVKTQPLECWLTRKAAWSLSLLCFSSCVPGTPTLGKSTSSSSPFSVSLGDTCISQMATQLTRSDYLRRVRISWGALLADFCVLVLTPLAPQLYDACVTRKHQVLLARVYDVAVESRIDHAPRLSQRLGTNVWLKREDTQPVFSFKIRGAYNRIAQLSEQEKKQGIITCSAG
jgi:hypothetical protein